MVDISGPMKCSCETIMDRIEDIDGVEFSYSWNKDIKEYEEVDMNTYGNPMIRWECPNCNNVLSYDEIEEIEE